MSYIKKMKDLVWDAKENIRRFGDLSQIPPPSQMEVENDEYYLYWPNETISHFSVEETNKKNL